MNTLDASTWLAEHGDYLFRVARRQLHSDELAEDAVQDTLLAALAAHLVDRHSEAQDRRPDPATNARG